MNWRNPPAQRFIDREVVAVVHGWITSSGRDPLFFIEKPFSDADWMQEAREVYKARNINYLMVDWRKGAWAGYDQATADTQVIGRSIAYAFNELKKQGHQETFVRKYFFRF